MNDLTIMNVRIVTPAFVIDDGTLTVKDGRISSLLRGGARGSAAATIVDGHGRFLLPGLIDLHNDGIEQEIEPRPRAVFPLAIALQSLESQLVAAGITTIFHSFSFMDGREGTLAPERLEPTIRELNRLRASGVIRHLVHARYEIIEWHHFERFQRLIDARMVNLVSFMNHTPGQGQFRDRENLVAYYMRKYGAQLPDIDAIIEERLEKSASPQVEETLERLMAHARKAGLPMASHDDESPEQVARMRGRGVSIAEFPIALDAALAAAAHGMHVVVGAPNVLRGESTSGNLSGREAIGNNTVDVLCSDYYTPAMLHAVFALARDKVLPLHDAVRLVSANPARAVGLSGELGSLQVGKRADMILVSEAGGVPTVVSAWVGGRRVYEKHDSALRPVGEQWAREAVTVDREAARVS